MAHKLNIPEIVDFHYTRLVIIGATGSGKSTLAERLARLLALDWIELDALHWRPGWMPASLDEFRMLVDEATKAPRWVASGNYSAVRDLIWSRAQALLWLDYPFWTIFWRLTLRIFRRWWRKELLWGTNYESLWVHFKFWSEDSLWHWLFKTYWRRKREYSELLTRAEYRHLQVFHFKHPQATEAWLSGLENFVHQQRSKIPAREVTQDGTS